MIETQQSPSLETPPKPPRPWTPLRVVGAGCGTITVLVLLFVIVGAVMLAGEYNKPYRAASEVDGLAGVPVYPGAQLDEEATRLARATATVSRGLYPANSTTAVGFRTDDDAQTKIIPFYDNRLAGLGFTKTTLGGGTGATGASYVADGCTVVIQTRSDPGEVNQLFVMRFDVGAKRKLEKRTDIVLPGDFKK